MAHVVVTRPVGQETELVERLRANGHRVDHVPLLEIEPIGDDPIDVSPFDLVVLTSPNGARELRRRMVGEPRKVAAIGRATADAFGDAAIVAEVATQEGLLAAIPVPAGRVLFAAGEGARTLLPTALGAEIEVLYRTVEVPASPFEADLVVLASASAARALARVGSPRRVVTIGPETTSAAVGVGLDVVAEAATHDLDGLVEAVGLAASGLE